MEHYKRVWDGLSRICVTIYGLEMMQDVPDDIVEMLRALAALAHSNESNFYAMDIVIRLRNCIFHDSGATKDLPDWSEVLEAANSLLSWLKTLKIKCISPETDFDSYIFWGEYITQVCELIVEREQLYKALKGNTGTLEAAKPAIELLDGSKLPSASKDSLADTSTAKAPCPPSIRIDPNTELPASNPRAQPTPEPEKTQYFAKGSLRELRWSIPRNSRIILLDGKYATKMGYLRKWNGTTVFVDLDHMGRKTISTKRRVGILRPG